MKKDEKILIQKIIDLDYESEYYQNHIDDIIDNQIHLFMIDNKLSEIDIDIEYMKYILLIFLV